MRQLTIAIAGCGTAGMAAATMLARDGHRVTIFERFDGARPVGSGLMLQPTGMAVLRSMGLAKLAVERGARIERLHGFAAGRTVLDVKYASLARDDAFGVGIHRSSLFDLLLKSARASGADLELSRDVRALNDGHLAFANGKSAGPFDLIVDATGSRSSIASVAARLLPYGALWTTIEGLGGLIPPDTLSQRYFRATQMAGLLPLGTNRKAVANTALFWSLRADQHEKLSLEGIGAWRTAWSALWPETAAFAEAVPSLESMNFARYSHRTLARPVDGNTIRIGDSWHSTSPQLGQGANQALLDAFALAKGLRESDDVGEALRRAVSLRVRHVRLYQALSRLLTPVYQSDGRLVPWLRDWLVGPVSSTRTVARIQAAMVSGFVGRPLHRLGLVEPCASGVGG